MKKTQSETNYIYMFLCILSHCVNVYSVIIQQCICTVILTLQVLEHIVYVMPFVIPITLYELAIFTFSHRKRIVYVVILHVTYVCGSAGKLVSNKYY